MTSARTVLLCFGALLWSSAGAQAQNAIVQLRFADGQFTPRELEIPAGKPTKVQVVNDSTVPMEFESFPLNREKVVVPHSAVIVHLPALPPGRYEFVDDFHPDVSNGVIVAK